MTCYFPCMNLILFSKLRPFDKRLRRSLFTAKNYHTSMSSHFSPLSTFEASEELVEVPQTAVLSLKMKGDEVIIY